MKFSFLLSVVLAAGAASVGLPAEPSFDVSLRPGAHGVYAPGETAELTLAVSNRTAAAAEKGRAFGFSFLLFDHDPPMKGFYWMELTPGIAEPFNPAKYKTLVLE